jgi:type I restriction enzyme S subunit
MHETAAAVTPAFHAKLKKSKLQPGDILFVRVGANRGDCCVVPAGIDELNCANIVFARPKVKNGFFGFYFRSPLGQSHLLAATTGAAQGVINTGSVAEMPVPVPPLPVQRRIAGILSAYDELIENSQRRIRLLEDMARALYREWFIHFRFPGNEPSPQPSPKRRGSQSAPLIPSALGDIPQGWEVTTLDQVSTKIGSGATPRGGKGAYKSEGISLIRSMNIYDYEFELADLAFIDDEQAAQLDNVTVEARDVLLNITGASVCRCSMVPSHLLPARVNQHVAIIRADTRRMDPFYLLDTINNDHNKQKLLNLAQGGATREALTKETICNFPILLPPPELLTRYGQVAGAMHAQRETLALQIQNLRRTRDLLLPRLLSGQVTLDSSLNSTHDAA